jgi:hypothetical protein
MTKESSMDSTRGPVELTWLGTESGEDGCPTAFATNHGTYVVQGWKVTDPTALAEMRRRGLPDHETAVEIPAALLKHLPAGE